MCDGTKSKLTLTILITKFQDLKDPVNGETLLNSIK